MKRNTEVRVRTWLASASLGFACGVGLTVDDCYPVWLFLILVAVTLMEPLCR